MGRVDRVPAAGGFTAPLEDVQRLEDLQHITEQMRDCLGIDHLVYHWIGAQGAQYGCGTYTPDWLARYVAQGYLRVDPVIQGCFQRFHPVDWKALDWSSKAARAYLKDALRHGVGNQGFTVPVRGPNGQFALFTVNHSCDDVLWSSFIAQWRAELILAAHGINAKALELMPGPATQAPVALSPRELDAMRLLASGLSRAQVAAELNISEHTVRVYIEGARFKLGALNTTHAVARAMSCGLIAL